MRAEKMGQCQVMKTSRCGPLCFVASGAVVGEWDTGEERDQVESTQHTQRAPTMKGARRDLPRQAHGNVYWTQ